MTVGETSDLEIGVQGMTCASCVGRVERGLGKVEGVKTASVNLATERATVRFDPARTSAEALIARVRDVGYQPVIAELDLPITGMTCANCVGRVERALSKVGGVLSASVNLASERAHIQYLPATTTPGQLKAAVREAGYGVLEADTGTASVDTQRAAREAEVLHLRSQVIFSAVFAVPLLLLAMLPMLVPALDAALMRGCAHDRPQLDHAGAGGTRAVRPRTALLPPGLGQPEAPQPRHERPGDDRHLRRLLLQPGGHAGPAALPGGHGARLLRGLGRGHHPDSTRQVLRGAGQGPQQRGHENPALASTQRSAGLARR